MQIRWIGPLAALTAAYGAGLLYEMTAAPAGCCGLTWPSPDPNQAERILGQRDPQARNAPLEKRAALTVLAARPGEPSAWIRLAYADALEHGRLTDASRRALDTSYLIAPYGGALAPWRIGLALETWGDLTRETRKQVIQEVDIALDDPHDRIGDTAKAMAGKVVNPSGRMAAALLGLTTLAPHAHVAEQD